MAGAVLALCGDVDHTNSDAWFERVDLALAEQVSELALDMSAVSSIDPAAISLLVRISRRAVETSADVVIRNPTGRVMRMLAVHGMSDYFPVHGAPANALGLACPTG